MKRIFALALAVVALSVAAQETESATSTTGTTGTTATTTTTTTAAEAPPPAPAANAEAAASGVTSPGSQVVSVSSSPDREGRLIHLRDEIHVGVTGYAALHDRAAAAQKPITLYINGIDSKLEATGIEPYTDPKMAPAERQDARQLTFFLTRTADNADLWRDILRDPFGEPETDLAFSAGVAEEAPLPLAPRVHGKLVLAKTFFAWPGVFWALLVIIVLVALFRYKSDMLRGGPPINGVKQAYSLGRSQMAWWFFLIMASYIVIWLITGDRDTITTELLVLMGISAATAMGSIAIDAAAPGRANETRQQLEAEKTSLQMAAETAGAQEQQAANAMKLRVAEIDTTMANAVSPSLTTGSWMRDVLTGNDGTVALHRFQVLVWTAVLGLIFLTSVARDLSMPEFSTTLLALMGISAGTYLGFKLPTNGG